MHTAQDDLELNHQYCVSPSATACTPGLLNHLAQRTPVALCMWELTPLMQALRIPSGWLYTITQLVTLLQYHYRGRKLLLIAIMHVDDITLVDLESAWFCS